MATFTRERGAQIQAKGSKSLARTIMLAVAVVIVIGSAINLYSSQTLLRYTIDDIAIQNDKEATALLAMHIATAVNYRQIGPIRELLVKLGAAPGSSIASAIVLSADQKPVMAYSNDKLPKIDLAAKLPKLLASGEASVMTVDGFELISTPILMGANQRRIGTFVIAWDRSRINATLNRDAVIGISINVIVSLSILLALGFLLMKLVTRPITSMTSAMRSLAAGDHEVAVPLLNRKDEMGEIAKAVQIFKDNAHLKIALEVKQSEENAVRERRARQIEDLCNRFEITVSGVIDRFMESTGSLQAASRQLSDAAASTLSQSSIVASASEAANLNVASASDAVGIMASSTQDFARQIDVSQNISRQAVAEAQAVNAKVETLALAVQQVDEVVKMISAIAGQTNLLALNATIEAARAGDAGRGFAIVASEVKSLAQQTEGATAQIGRQINEMRSAMDDAISSVHSISDVIGQIDTVSAATSQVVANQSATTEAIVHNVREAAEGTARVASSIEQVTQLSGQTDKAANLVHQSSNAVVEQSQLLRREVTDFIRNVQVA